MKIVFTGTIFFNQKVGGISRYYTMLAKNISENYKIISPLSKNLYLKQVPSKNKYSIHLKKIPNFKILNQLNEKITNNLINLYKPDIIHETYYSKNIINLNKYKKIITVYDLIHEKFNHEYSIDQINKKKFIIEHIDHFICISNQTKKDLINYYNISEKKISVVHLGCDHFKEQKFLLKNKIEKPYILFIGSRRKYKNFEVLLNSLKMLKNEDISLICFGGEKFNKNDIAQNKSKINIININGDDAILHELIKNAFCYINTSLYEGFGLPNLEAMFLECPTICSNIEVFNEVCGNSVLYFDPYDSENLANCIDMVFESNSLKEKLKVDGKNRAELFKWEKCAKETTDIYKKLI